MITKTVTVNGSDLDADSLRRLLEQFCPSDPVVRQGEENTLIVTDCDMLDREILLLARAKSVWAETTIAIGDRTTEQS